jgi:hypothetical protein
MVGRRRLTRNGPIQGQPAATLHDAQPYDRGEYGFYGPSAGPITYRAHDTEMDDPWPGPLQRAGSHPQPGDRREHPIPTARTPRRELSVIPQR